MELKLLYEVKFVLYINKAVFKNQFYVKVINGNTILSKLTKNDFKNCG